MSSYEPLFLSDASGVGVWLGGFLGAPPDTAKIHDRWLHAVAGAAHVDVDQVTRPAHRGGLDPLLEAGVGPTGVR